MAKQYPKYQWSTFLKGNRDEQIVLRTDDWHEFLGEVKKIKEALAKQETPKKDVYERYDEAQDKCQKCGAERVKNPKTGKYFCKEKCWLK